MTSNEPFWPRQSPNFLACRVAVRAVVGARPRRLAVGLSGGADSLALTAALVAEGHDVTALCVDHGLQEGSAEQARRAADQAQAWGAGAEVIRVDVDKHGSVEAAARTARYRAFAPWGEVAVAHTADDQAETLLLGALRGKVSGMLERAEVEGAHVLRPLLTVRRAHTEAACAELGVEPWQDPHNVDPTFRRVALRRDILPRLADIVGGDPIPALAQAAQDAALDDASLLTPPTNSCVELAAMPEPKRRRAIAAWLREQGIEVTREAIRGVDNLCTQWHGQGGVAVSAAAGHEGRGEKVGTRLEVFRVGGTLSLLPRSSKERSRARQS